jgi:uncharacterized iron-regulated membrane protein
LINTQLITRKAHRWLGLLIGIQLLLWSLSGLYFAVVPSSEVAGAHNKAEHEPVNFAFTPLVSPQQVISALVVDQGPSVQVRGVSLQRLQQRNVFQVHYDVGGESLIQLADASFGELLAGVDERQALAIAEADFTGAGRAVGARYLAALEPGHEYRWGELPVWQISFDDPENTRVYVAARTGVVITHRNDTWRVFDFFWMLHIMDFSARTDFHTLLLQVASVLSLVTIVSGFILWFMTTSLFKRRIGAEK